MPYIETAPFPQPKTPEKTQDGWSFSENLFFRLEKLINQRRLLTLEEWRKLYKKIYKIRGFSEEDALSRYQGAHGSLAFEIQNENQEADLNFLGEKLSGLRLDDRTISAFQLYRLGVVCLRRPKPGSEEIMEAWGRALIQAAFKRYQDPQYARGAIDELVLKARQRGEKRKRERKQQYRGKIKGAGPQIFQRFNAPEVFGMHTSEDYQKQLKYWQDQLAQMTKDTQIDWQMFRKEYKRLVGTARKIRDTRVYDKTGFYKRIDYEEMLRNKDPEAIIKGLAALYATREEKECEIPGFNLLIEGAFKLPPPRTIYRPPQPWQAFVVFVIKEELIRKLGEVTSKLRARKADFVDTFIRTSGGGEPEQVTNRKPTHASINRAEKIPF